MTALTDIHLIPITLWIPLSSTLPHMQYQVTLQEYQLAALGPLAQKTIPW